MCFKGDHIIQYEAFDYGYLDRRPEDYYYFFSFRYTKVTDSTSLEGCARFDTTESKSSQSESYFDNFLDTAS